MTADELDKPCVENPHPERSECEEKSVGTVIRRRDKACCQMDSCHTADQARHLRQNNRQKTVFDMAGRKLHEVGRNLL